MFYNKLGCPILLSEMLNMFFKGGPFFIKKNEIFGLFKLLSVDFSETIGLNFDYRSFAEFTKLTCVKLPKNIGLIGRSAFTRLAIVEIFINEVDTIGYDCFVHCEFLTTVRINSVNQIGQNCFFNCTVLNTIHYNSSKEPFYDPRCTENLIISIFDTSTNISRVAKLMLFQQMDIRLFNGSARRNFNKFDFLL